MILESVTNKKEGNDFIQTAVELNRDDPNWIRPLDKDIREVFDPEKNKSFRFGECMRWILKDGWGRKIGRVAAFSNKKYMNKGTDFPVGGMGFFECINDQQAADTLFDQCKSWLKERGMEAMDGPINFGERDRWWGLVVDGYHPPLYCMNYNPPYYKTLFEQYGFRVYFNQICFGMRVDIRLAEKFYNRHDKLASDPGYSSLRIDKKNMHKFIEDFTTVYNKAWAEHGGNKTLEKRQSEAIFHAMKPVIDKDLVWFIYYKNEPIACWLNLPDLNYFFRHMNGKFGILQKLRFFWMMKRGACKKFVGIVFGVVPEFQGKGVDAYMIVEGANVIKSMDKYQDFEMQWVGDFNSKMINMVENMEVKPTRTLSTYRYLFDPNREFQRHPFLI